MKHGRFSEWTQYALSLSSSLIYNEEIMISKTMKNMQIDRNKWTWVDLKHTILFLYNKQNNPFMAKQ